MVVDVDQRDVSVTIFTEHRSQAFSVAAVQSELLVHDEFAESPNLAFVLSRMVNPAFPAPIGVFRQVEHPTYEQGVIGQVTQARKSRGPGKLSDLYSASDTWTIKTHENGHEDDHNGHHQYDSEG